MYLKDEKCIYRGIELISSVSHPKVQVRDSQLSFSQSMYDNCLFSGILNLIFLSYGNDFLYVLAFSYLSFLLVFRMFLDLEVMIFSPSFLTPKILYILKFDVIVDVSFRKCTFVLICQELLFCYRTNRFITEKEWKNVVKERLRGRATVWKSKLEKMSHFVTKCLRKKDNQKNQTYFFEEFWHSIDSFQFTVSENVE